MLIRPSHWVVWLPTLWGLGVALPPALPQQDINTINCFDLVDESQWDLVLGLNMTTASLSVVVSGAGPPVITCLNRQTVRYLVSVVGDTTSQPYLLSELHTWEGISGQLVRDPPTFPYLIYGGRYRLQFTHCGQDRNMTDSCREGRDTKTVFSDFVNIQPSVNPWCSPAQFTGNTSLLSLDTPAVKGTTTVFHFSFSPCSTVQPYDTANVTLYSADTREECGQEVTASQSVEIFTNTAGEAAIMYQSPELAGDRYYCLSVTLSHISCRLTTLERPTHCWLESDAVWVPATPIIASILPFCTSHFACAWLYIVVGGSISLIVSLVMAITCVRCCERRDRNNSKQRDEVDFPGEVISLAPLTDRRGWAELHKEWESREEKARGKILLLYSPDTKLFKELQEAFKSFLDLACHCDIYDLFDDALFDTIALDPSEWLQEFVNDKDVKIVVMSSIGAYRRQQALAGEMPLNLPDNSLLDGLFTSGLRFISSYPGLATSGRVATARFEMLHLTEEGHKLGPPLSGPDTREFLIPTQLHELFCWVHQLKPLDLMGKPWVNYHLEMQLLQDALKLVRRDRTVMDRSCGGQPNFTDLGNGVTMI
eukprot:GFUD01058419.1.p1 GENE.GFUD01058419.1~~GFUD01058419.1.p1  ORF type:complete len:595 (+),score=197.68 GFUD01058419.1:320-2104(+)